MDHSAAAKNLSISNVEIKFLRYIHRYDQSTRSPVQIYMPHYKAESLLPVDLLIDLSANDPLTHYQHRH